jgi:hypothetical protein
MQRWMQVETLAGAGVDFQGWRVVPFVKTVRLQVPGMQGGMVWTRPATVLAIAPDGTEQVLPVQDVTRRVVALLFGAGLVAWFVTFFLRRRKYRGR